ncbi:MAG: WYL domain-containing protein [Thermodesulfobacteriota bacterium]|nr:WYL domain-containing protein [Thermodesulfobacteriota bacterium]
MPEKIDPYRSYGQKLISLFAKLLFSGKSHSLIELSKMLNCSKQTVLRLVGDIRRSYGVDIEEMKEGRKRFYRIKRLSASKPVINLTDTELNALYMCKIFAQHLLGHGFLEEANRGLEKNRALFPDEKQGSFNHFASFYSGSIDYTSHHKTILLIINAMENKKICKITYKAIMSKKAKTFYIKPLKIFSHRDTVYLHAKKARTPKKPYDDPDFDPLLAIHRIRKIETTDRLFTIPKDYDFEKVFNKKFGVIKEEAFRVELEFSGWAAAYVSERIWSADQKIVKKRDGKTRLTFSTSSEPELISSMLSFGDEVKVIKPKWLVDEIKEVVNKMERVYE